MANNQAAPAGRQAKSASPAGGNILIFSTAYLPLVGGAEIAVDEITKRLPDWQFDLITAKIKVKLAGEERINNVNVYRVGLGWGILDKFLLPLTGFFKARQLDKKKRYLIIWPIMASQAGVAAAVFKVFRPDRKLLLTLQEGDEEKHLERYVLGIGLLYRILIRPWHLLVFGKADYLTVISGDLRKRALRNGVKVPIEIVPNGIDSDTFGPGKEPAGFTVNLKRELGIESGEKVILTVSRLVKKNAVGDLIRAGQYLNFPFKILIIGDGAERDKLKKLAKKLNLEDKVEFLLRQDIPQPELAGYYQLADVFVRPSISEGLGNVFLEALAAGIPIIGTPVGGIPDFLIDRETGLFCQTGDPKGLARKIEEVLRNDSLRKTLRANGLELVGAKYQWDAIAAKMRRIYQKLSL